MVDVCSCCYCPATKFPCPCERYECPNCYGIIRTAAEGKAAASPSLAKGAAAEEEAGKESPMVTEEAAFWQQEAQTTMPHPLLCQHGVPGACGQCAAGRPDAPRNLEAHICLARSGPVWSGPITAESALEHGHGSAAQDTGIRPANRSGTSVCPHETANMALGILTHGFSHQKVRVLRVSDPPTAAPARDPYAQWNPEDRARTHQVMMATKQALDDGIANGVSDLLLKKIGENYQQLGRQLWVQDNEVAPDVLNEEEEAERTEVLRQWRLVEDFPKDLAAYTAASAHTEEEMVHRDIRSYDGVVPESTEALRAVTRARRWGAASSSSMNMPTAVPSTGTCKPPEIED